MNQRHMFGARTLQNGLKGFWSVKVDFWAANHFDNESSLITPSEEIRMPLLAVLVNDDNDDGSLPPSAVGVQLSQKGIIITAFGKKPDGDGTVLRLWEQAGKSGKCTVTLPDNVPFKTARFCDLRGEAIGNAFNIEKSRIDMDIKAYEPVSVLLK